MLGRCGACGRSPLDSDIKVVPSSGGFLVQCKTPWRIKNAARNELGIPSPTAVVICSDICEARYEAVVGYWAS